MAPISRATKPSAMSSTIETAMSAAATVKWPSNASITEDSPLIMLSVVNALGREQPGPLALGQLAQRDDPRARGRDEPPAVEDASAPGAAGLVTTSPGPGAPSGR